MLVLSSYPDLEIYLYFTLSDNHEGKGANGDAKAYILGELSG